MNIVINAVLAFEKPRGVGRYINNLLPEIAKHDKENHYYVYYGKWMHEYEFLNIRQDNFHFIELDIKNSQLARNLFLATKLPLMAKKLNPDIFWLVDTQAIFFKPCKMVSTIHDLAEFEVPEKYSAAPDDCCQSGASFRQDFDRFQLFQAGYLPALPSPGESGFRHIQHCGSSCVLR